MKILYIHGLSSSGASGTPANLRQLLPNDIVISPDLPIDPIKALNMLHDICSVQNIDIVVGTSMGGMFAQQIHGYRKIIINPSFHVSQSMRKIMGINHGLTLVKMAKLPLQSHPSYVMPMRPWNNTNLKVLPYLTATTL